MLSYVVAFADRVVIGLMTPAIKSDLGLSDTQMSLLQGLAFALCYTLCGLPIGWLADRTNRTRLLAAGMATWSTMTALCGFSSAFGTLFLARMGVGVGEATLTPCSTSLLGDCFPPHRRSPAFGLFAAAPAIGTFLAFTGGGLVYAWLETAGGIALPLLGHLQPWQGTFVALGVPGLIVSALLVLTVREPRRIGMRPTDATHPGPSSGAYFRTNATTLVCHHVGISMVLMAVYGYVAWLPSLFQRSYGWSAAQFGIAFGLPGGLCGLVGALVAGYAGSWWRRGRTESRLLHACAIGGALSAIGGVLTPLMPSGATALAAYLATTLFNNSANVLGLAAIAEMAPNQFRGRVTGTYVVCTGLVASTLGPLIVGAVSDAFSPDPLGVGYGLMLVAGVIALPGAGLIALGCGPYRASVARAR
jgi:MFS family permease